MEQKQPRVVIMSRTHDADLACAIIERGWKDMQPLMIEMPPSCMMSSNAVKFGNAWLDPRATYEIQVGDEVLKGMRPVSMGIDRSTELRMIEMHIPWLDGAREHMMALAVWADGG